MKLEAFIPLVETTAPPCLAESWDNPGLLIEPEQREITKVLVALDCTLPVVQEAAQVGAQLVLSHHPLFFQPVRRIHYSLADTAPAWHLIRHGVGLYAAHTNLDSALGGVNDVLAQMLGLDQVRPLLQPGEALSELTQSIGRVGELPQPLSLQAFAAFVQRELHTTALFAGDPLQTIRRVAVLGGSGGDFLPQAKAAQADVLVTGEAKHHQGLEAHAMGVALIQAGHYETERPVLELWIKGLQLALKRVQCKVELIVSGTQSAPFRAP